MESRKLLSQFKLRKTALREEVISLFANHQKVAFSEQEINEMFKSFDRVSIYRTIRTFLDKMIIHKIVCHDGVLKYAFTPQKDASQQHPHFECTTCHTVSCIETRKGIQKVSVPKGYAPVEFQFLVQGLCPKCREK